ncbi:MAG TPA: aldehyde ferredoxin oxidoreductase family protein [Candidatus Deferrimicrobium sp.]|nr:aldehyde ferredoxin oxidoreductase family protein [Candidatus Deferrimicrobium sp.]
MVFGGFAGKILEINLTSKSTKKRFLDSQFARRYIGGRGFGARIIWDRTNSTINPLGPENILVMAAGPLTGLLIPGSGKTAFVSVSPATGIYGDSNIGGHIGLRLKQAGFDILILTGKAASPTILQIQNEKVDFLSATPYWGHSAVQAENAIKSDLGDSNCAVCTIGPAGENLVRFASIQSEHRFAGRTGLGAVLGSKNLKGLAIQGDKDIPIANSDKLLEVFKSANSYLKNHKIADIYQRQGTLGLLEGVNEVGILPVRNFQDGMCDYASEVGGNKFEEVFTDWHAHSCLYCHIACEGIANTENGIRIRPQYESAAMLGPNIGVKKIKEIVELNNLCNNLGVDTISAGNLIGLLMECIDRKILSQADFNGIDLTWGNSETVQNLLKIIANREGIGNIIADGILSIIKNWPQCTHFAMHCKGLEQSGYDTRGLLGMSLAYGTADIGAHHNRAWVAYQELTTKDTYKKIAQLVIFHQHFRPLMDCLGACRFPWIEFNIAPTIYADFYKYAVGLDPGFSGLMERSEAIYNITRAINLRFGMKRKNDYPSPRTFSDPVPKGPFKGKFIHQDQYDHLLDFYYELRGWDQDGIPKKDTLIRLGLEDLVEYI